ncbi:MULTISPECIES: phosphatidylserine decarboxylase [unclassified Lentimicrobium]|uniref:phosphatidylserine decarboxylase n=1 Tax=unclassified Lentimicrobium TaxID=2677434 RepID=UPI0015533CA3|nr:MULTISPECIES: phosphatidylserine decarboxylase [unclassified Lentimicrobium]NPD44941.1 phosphatidylserine decarboxylase [Lentimicrobium sp. S6]NPD85864.1 phosphatidylserine decarboxylase [Lentimicrobium sp. L6]
MRNLNLKNIFFFLLVGFIVLAFIPFKEIEPITYVERTSGEERIEKVPGEAWLYWLYYNPVGELSLNTMVKNKFLSSWYGQQMDKPSSKEKIEDFVSDFKMDLSEAVKKDFESFNDFFYRKLKKEARPINLDSSVLVSPADGKVLAYSDISKQDFIVKGYRFNVYDYFQNDEIAQKYENGSLMIFRLCPTDYHRYHFPIGGEVAFESKIDGDYYSVSPIALKKKIKLIAQNKREYTVIKTEDFGDVIMSEVGATMVGSMVTTYSDPFIEKGQEKGYFKFGGSTVILFFEEGKIEIDSDLLLNSQNQIETSVLMGEGVARVK